jgi:PGF-CTERM protein
MSRLPNAAVAVLLVVGVATGAAVGAQSTPTVAPSDATVAVGETTTIAVPLSAAPDGLSGFNLTVEAAGENARVVDATVADEFGITTERVEDGRATLEGVDLGENVEAGAEDVRLGTVTVRGVGGGSADLGVDVRKMDDDDGEPVSPKTGTAEVTVTGDDGGSSSSPGDGDDGRDRSDGTATAGGDDPATPTPSSTDGRPGDGATATADGPSGASPSGTVTDTDGDGAGFGPVVGVVGVLVALLLRRR